MLCNNCGKESAGCWSKCPNCGAEKLPNSEEEEDGVKLLDLPGFQFLR